MIDEAHRSQYNAGTNLDKSLPYAARIAYTGTPIDRTESTFASTLINTPQQSIEDGTTLVIVYEGRTHNAEIPDKEGMIRLAAVFSDYNSRAFATRLVRVILPRSDMSSVQSEDMLYIMPNVIQTDSAQVVAMSR
jgi:hypothetical protein